MNNRNKDNTFLANIQSRRQTKACTVFCFKELLLGAIVFPPMLKVDSETTVEKGIVKRSRALM